MTFQLIPQAYAASTWADECTYTVADGGGKIATIKGVECLFKNLINPIPALLAVVAVIMIIFAGIRLLTAGADPKAVASAWNTFSWAIIGLILLSAAWLVLVLIGKFTGTPVTTFTLPTF